MSESAGRVRGARLPPRLGPPPATTSTNPHTQLDQQPEDDAIRAKLAQLAFSLPQVVERPSLVSVPGARGLWLDESVTRPRTGAFMIGREFAQLHPAPDFSLHMILPPDLVADAIRAGWAELHPVARRGLIPATTVMVYAPRDAGELETVGLLLEASYRFALGPSHGGPSERP